MDSGHLPILLPIICAAIGAGIATCAACVPALHAFSLIGALLFIAQGGSAAGAPEAVIGMCLGLTVGFAAANSIPAVLLSAPDDSAVLMVSPGQNQLMSGRAYEAVIDTAAGGVGAWLILLCVVAPLAPAVLPAVMTILAPHWHWVLWCIVCFTILSERPLRRSRQETGRPGLGVALRASGIALFTFTLSALFGLAVSRLMPAGIADFRHLLPALVGLFGLPRVILNISCNMQPPEQTISRKLTISRRDFAHGVSAGAMGGGLAGMMPMVSGGIGGLLSHQLAGNSSDRVLLISQGASKFVYYVGGLLLMYVPGTGSRLPLWMAEGLHLRGSLHDYHIALTSVAVAGAVAFGLLPLATRICLRAMSQHGYRRISCGACLVVTIIVLFVSGPGGIGLMLVGLGIGLIPALFHARQIHCLGFILIPAALRLSGL